eukprot:7159894-Pyramimonas_sp.AAC.1
MPPGGPRRTLHWCRAFSRHHLKQKSLAMLSCSGAVYLGGAQTSKDAFSWPRTTARAGSRPSSAKNVARHLPAHGLLIA